MNAVIFDLDGTLWDSSENVAASWNIVLEKHPESKSGKITVSDMRGLMGKQMDEIARIIMPKADEKTRAAVMRECMDIELEYLSRHKSVFYPYLSETLAELSEKYALMIVSNCQCGYIELFLRQLRQTCGINPFCDFECFGKTGLSKGENIELVIKRNSVTKAVYLGDTQGDLDAADKAGIIFIHAVYGFGKTNRKTAKISALSELEKICGEIFEI